MKTSRGKAHEYLGMNLDYSVKCQVKITILDYIKEMLNCFENEEPKSRGPK